MLDPICQQSIVAATSVRTRIVPTGPDGQLFEPRLEIDLQWALLESFNRLNHRIVALGCLSAADRVQEFLLEIHRRMQSNGRATTDICPMPLTQMDLADILGLSAGHLNRVLQGLRQDAVLELRDRTLHVDLG